MFTSFETSEKHLFLVNRGWISKENFDYEADIKTEDIGISIQGVLSPFTRFGLNLTDETFEPGWPKLVQQIDYQAAVTDLGINLHSFVLQLSAGSVGALEHLEACRPATFKTLWLCASMVWTGGSFNKFFFLLRI